MASKKRWDTIYDKINPFSLPQDIARQVRSIAEERSNDVDPECMRYLWIYVSPVEGVCAVEDSSDDRPLETDEWLSIIDESAALGTECVVISTGQGLDDHPEILAMCSWAQETHGMLVGLHVYRQPLTEEEIQQLTALYADLFGLFADVELVDQMPLAEELGIRVYNAECDGREMMNGNCTIPEGMTCVGPTGKMYACGYVYGNKKYAMGHCFEKELGTVMNDETIPRTIPKGDARALRRCNGCPPLMKHILQKAVSEGRVSASNKDSKKK